MANFPSFRHLDTGVTLYVVLRNAAGQWWETTGPGYETALDSPWADYDIAAAETPASSYQYIAAVPATLTADAFVYVDYYLRVTGAPLITDTLLGTDMLYWDGTAIIEGAVDIQKVDNDATASSNLEAMYDGTGYLGGTIALQTDMTTIHGTALTETAGQLAGSFIKFFDVAAPTATALSLPDAVPGAAGGGFIAGSNATTTIAALNVSSAMTVNSFATVAGMSIGTTLGVTGATTFTGVVTASNGIVADITGNLSGSIGSVGTGGIVAASFAADAIAAAAIATGAFTADAFAADALVAATFATGAFTADAFAADSLIAATFATGAISADAVAATALDNITATAPGGVASTFPEMMVQTWRRFYMKSTLTDSQLKTYADNNTDLETTQGVTDDSTTQTMGAAT